MSLVLLAATLVLWPLHRRKMSAVVYNSPNHERLLAVRPFGVYLASGKSYRDNRLPDGSNAPSILAPKSGWNFCSESLSHDVVVYDTLHLPGVYTGAFDAYESTPSRMRVWYVLIGYPWLLTVFATLPVLWGVRTARKHSRLRGGRCVACGYSLTGNTTGTCPECGARIDNCEKVTP